MPHLSQEHYKRMEPPTDVVVNVRQCDVLVSWSLPGSVADAIDTWVVQDVLNPDERSQVSNDVTETAMTPCRREFVSYVVFGTGKTVDGVPVQTRRSLPSETTLVACKPDACSACVYCKIGTTCARLRNKRA